MMSGGGLVTEDHRQLCRSVKMVVASAVDEEGEEIYPRKWNHEFIDMPIEEDQSRTRPASPPKS